MRPDDDVHDALEMAIGRLRDLAGGVRNSCDAMALALADLAQRRQEREDDAPVGVSRPLMGVKVEQIPTVTVRASDLAALCEALRALKVTNNHLDTAKDIQRPTNCFDGTGRDLDGWIEWAAKRGRP